MYHYMPYTSDHAGGVLFRAPREIREELLLIREELKTAESRMEEAEARKEELVLSLSATPEDSELLTSLTGIIEDCEELKGRLEELWEHIDTLSDELSDALFLLHGTPA